MGKLNNGFCDFVFTRAWTYYIVVGLVPIKIAEYLYADPVGKRDIRVAGHCGRPEPKAPWIEWLDNEKKTILSLKEKVQYEEYIQKSGALKSIANDLLNTCVFSDTPEKIGSAFVKVYHIDSIIGLRVFVDVLMITQLSDLLQLKAAWDTVLIKTCQCTESKFSNHGLRPGIVFDGITEKCAECGLPFESKK